MSEGEGRRPRRGRIVAAALLLALLLALAVLWGRREPIARDYVDRALAARGVPARYEITRLGVTSQRLEKLVIGDPRAPDLTAESVNIRVGVRAGWPQVRSLTARGVRLRGRLVDGKLSLGAVDRLMPAPSGAPFALPDLAVDLGDARMRLETPYGPVGLTLNGRGNLADGFKGRLAAVAPRLDVGGCRADRATAFVDIAIVDRKPAFAGPLRAASLRCAGVGVRAIDVAVDARANDAIDRFDGSAVLRVGAVQQAGGEMGGISGRVSFAGTAADLGGEVAITAASTRTGPIARGRAALSGSWRKAAWTRFDGTLALTDAAIAPAALRPIVAARDAAIGTPAGPLWQELADAVVRAGSDAAATATFRLVQGPRAGGVRVSSAGFQSASGARAVLGRGRLSYYWPSGGSRIEAADIAVQGGGLPAARLRLSQGAIGAPITGLLTAAPLVARGSQLELAPARFTIAGDTRFATVVTLSGPVADGRVTGLRLAVEGRFADGRLAIGERCVPLDFARLEVAGLMLGPSRLPLCPTGGALFARGADGRFAGGAAIVRPRLSGTIGSAPATIAVGRLGITIGRPGFAAEMLEVRIGAGETVTRLDVAQLSGDAAAGGIAGTFAGAGGNIGAVPLLLSESKGGWRLAAGVLTLEGHLRLADRAAAPRFNPLESDDVKLRLAGGRIVASGRLVEPKSRSAISDVTLVHDLSTGIGSVGLAVPGILFGDALQPEALTPLTLGVVANVQGVVSGRGDIRWTPDGATSDGRFRTDALALAAAFGPVSGIKGEIVFSDLLALATPPGQVATIAEVNPGVAVTEGVVSYQLLPGQLVKVEGGRWPFSGGELTLDPTTMDFGRPSERRMTFRVVGMDAAEFVQQFQLKNIALTGTFDGVLPMLFDAQGGRIVGGRLTVRGGGGTLAYVGEVSNAKLGMFAKLAFDALKSMRYDALAIELDGALDGELVSRVLFNGTNETPKEAKGGLLAQLTGLPFRFNITIRAPFRGLLNSAQSLNDPRAFIAQALPRDRSAPAPVQPPESETVP